MLQLSKKKTGVLTTLMFVKVEAALRSGAAPGQSPPGLLLDSLLSRATHLPLGRFSLSRNVVMGTLAQITSAYTPASAAGTKGAVGGGV